jgi:polyisoprenoid-binding protein YceI
MTDTLAGAGLQTAQQLAGKYKVDPAHSAVEFVARYLMLTKVRGRFGDVEGTFEIAEQPEQSKVDVVIQTASIDTGDETRDGHLRGEDFLDVENFPTIEFHSTQVEPTEDGAKVTGDLTVKGVTRPIVLDVEYTGTSGDPWGNTRLGFNAESEIDREDWGLTWNVAIESGGVLVGKRVKIELSISAIKL